MDKTIKGRIFNGLLKVQSVPITDHELAALQVPEERWPSCRVGYEVDFKGEIDVAGMGGMVGAILRSFLNQMEIPEGVPPEFFAQQFAGMVFAEALAGLRSGVQLNTPELRS